MHLVESTPPRGGLRIAYLVSAPGGPSSGIYKKVVDQIRAWQHAGADVGLFVRADGPSAEHWQVATSSVRIFASASNAAARWRARRRAINEVKQWGPQLLYIRQASFSPDLAAIMERVPTVIEINSDDIAEAEFISLPRRIAFLATRRSMLARAAGLAFVSEELAASPRFSSARATRIVVPNSIDLERRAPVPRVEHDGVRLIFIGSPGGERWHGLDRLARLAAAFPSWVFDVVGYTPSAVPDSPPNLVFHGMMAGSEYQQLLARADVAVATLGLYRQRMQEASPLKVREYLAAGLPVITAFRDSHWPDGAPFLLRLPNGESDLALERERVEQFVLGWRGRRVPRSDVARIDITVNETLRLRFLEGVAAARTPKSVR